MGPERYEDMFSLPHRQTALGIEWGKIRSQLSRPLPIAAFRFDITPGRTEAWLEPSRILQDLAHRSLCPGFLFRLLIQRQAIHDVGNADNGSQKKGRFIKFAGIDSLAKFVDTRLGRPDRSRKARVAKMADTYGVPGHHGESHLNRP